MSNKHIENLTVRLLQALDKNYDVVNMDAVLSVIAALENTKITKEQLEATRLAKYINLFRRRARSEQLAKRAKSLLKKWREMVGMQQRPLNSCNELRNESASSSNFQENINLIEGITTIQQNPVISFTPIRRNAYSNSSNTDKSLDHNKSIGKLPNKTVPTSFSNVLSGFSGTPTDRNPPSFTNFNVANGPSARRKNCNLKRSADFSSFPETFTFEQQTNLKSLENCAPIAAPIQLGSSTEPIIIDIEDSNSGSNLLESASRVDKESEVVVVGSTLEKPNKHKKTKKDKKRTKERENFTEISAPLVVIDAESSLSQQSNLRKIAEKDLLSITDEKSRNENLLVTNMSEILSLSNSSMSSVFPTSSVGATKNLFSQQGNRPLSDSDLSFAGKFAQQGESTLSPISSSTLATTLAESKSDFLPYNDGTEDKMTAEMSVSTNTFQPFTGTGCVSNDSASNSRHSTFGIIDSSSRGNKTQSKRLESDSSFPTHRPKFAASKDAIVEKQQPSLMTGTTQSQTNANTSVTNQMPEQKVPKKRGRKKGSKGVDSLIAKDTSLSSQMLIQSLGSGAKKVKTTKELYAEMQNRKLGVSTPTTPSQWAGTQSQTFVRRDSFCSEPSLHSPRTFDACSTNATVSTIATSSTPEKTSLQRHTVDIDSCSDSLISGGQSRESTALVSTSEKVESSGSVKLASELSKKQSAGNILTAVESQLREFANKLPAVPSIEKIEMELAEDTVPCTCTVLEVLPEQLEQNVEIASVGDLLSLDALKASHTNAIKDESNEPVITISVEKVDEAHLQPSTIAALKTEPTISNESQKPKRSIFDLDFDDDEDPLQTLIAEVAAASGFSNTEDNVHNSVKSTDSKDIDSLDQAENSKEQDFQPQHTVMEDQQLLSQETPPIPPPAMPTYTIEEDENCLAKQRFELQVQKITNFHIRALHNFYIPNVNGNWDNAFSSNSNTKAITSICTAERLLPDGINVVPRYCSFENDEYIKKDLRDVEFDSNFKPNLRSKAVEQLFYEKPFLGVSRCLKNLKSSHRKTRKHRKDSQLGKIDAEVVEKSIEENIEGEGGNLLDNENSVETMKIDEPNDLRSQMVSSNPSLNLVFNDITINVDETIPAVIKGIAPAETPTLLAIASNVNFNNNQIENDFTGENANAAEKPCVNKLEKEAGKTDLNAQDKCITLKDNGDIKNNNFNDKMEESSCESHSSLKQTQKSINLKLRKHRRQIIEQEQNTSKSYSKRKRRRKKSLSPEKPQKVKCIRIAINGGITTQRHIKEDSISDDEDDESDSDSYACNSDETETHARGESDSDNVVSEESGEEKGIEYTLKSREKEWNQYKDAALSEHEDAEDEEDYDYDDDDELDEEDEYSGEFHEVVTRDISPSSESGNNHIVLTIKKTPSKTNSPSGSLPPISPVVSNNKILTSSTNSTDKVEEKTKETVEKISNDVIKSPKDTSDEVIITLGHGAPNTAETESKLKESIVYKSLLEKYKLKRPFSKRKRRLLRRKSKEYKPFRFPYELKTEENSHERIFKKLHQKLFFPHEVYLETTGGSKRRMFDMSSCSSSCAELSEYEEESPSDSDIKSDTVDKVLCNKKALPESKGSPKKCSTVGSDTESDDTSTSGSEDEQLAFSDSVLKTEAQSKVDMDDNEVLPEANNGLLASFNNICTPTSALEALTDSATKIKKCDEPCRKDLSNSENYNDSMDHETKANLKNDGQIIPRPEYSTGLRDVDQSLNDKGGNNCSGPQQFREWHQLLQLRSYNDELLTVLPYVVLD